MITFLGHMGHGNHKEWVKDGEILLDSSMVSGPFLKRNWMWGMGKDIIFPLVATKIIKESRSPVFHSQ
jgi:hypothetical protein